jgi:preprotein translocase subunit SecA
MRLAARGDDRYPKRDQQAQGPLHYAIVDKVDNILIDEARTPLIISGPAEDDVTKYQKADKIARQLKRDLHFEVKEKEHTAHLTDDGVREAEKLAGVESFYTAGNMQWPHLIDNSLKAHHLYKRDVNYVVQEDEVVIVDEFTGRLMPGRHWSDGLHQAVEAKEGVRIKEENQTLATITLQNFFKLYDKISGMTGTAMTEAGEFWKIYKLDVIAVPTNRVLRRAEHPDVIYRTEKEKFIAIADEIERLNKYDALELKDGRLLVGHAQKKSDGHMELRHPESKKTETVSADQVVEHQPPGRPVLVGTVSIEKSERLSSLLSKRGIKHEVLNAKHHKREAEIVAQAGRKAAVTIATNMAGRGTDIILGGNPETMAWAQLQEKYPTRLDVPQAEWDALVKEIEQREGMKKEGDEVKQLGGLHIIGTERHEARRIDLQLRGRCGRQGDPGSSRFYLSLEDDHMRIFAGEWVKNVLTRLGMQDGEAIESRMVSRRIEGAQKKVEERNFEIRKNLLEYDEVMDEQRKRVYRYRQQILDGANCRDLILQMIDKQVEDHLQRYLDPMYGPESYAVEAGRRLSVQLESKAFRGAPPEEGERVARDVAHRMAETQILDAIEENVSEDVDESEWSWEALAHWLNTRWNLSLRHRDLEKIGRDQLAEVLIARAHEAIDKVDLAECSEVLAPNFGARTACAWLAHKFDVALDPEEVGNLEPPQFMELAKSKARQAYADREAEYPVLAGLSRFTSREGQQQRFDREELVAWARQRFNADLSLDDVRSKQRAEIRDLLVTHSKKTNEHATALAEQAKAKVSSLLSTLQSGHAGNGAVATAAHGNGKFTELKGWLQSECGYAGDGDELAALEGDDLLRRVRQAVEDKYRPEMRRMERALIISILDAAWKEHLLAMDHLRSSIGLRGYAQVDPKVEYKREGMRLFEAMWGSVFGRVTELIFKVEQLDERFVRSTWIESEAIHEEAPGAAEMTEQQRAAIEGSQADRKLEPIRNLSKKVGRNDPCPCGSGKKYKQCCMRHGG